MTSLSSQWLAAGAALTADAALRLAEADGQRSFGWMAWWLVIVVIVLSLAVHARRQRARTETWNTSILLLLPLGPLLREVVTRLAWQTGRPFELLVMSCVDAVMLGAAAVGCRREFQRIAMLASVFLIVFASAVEFTVGVQWLLGTYAACALSWLIVGHRELLRQRTLVGPTSGAPRWAVVGSLMVVGITTVTYSVGDERTQWVLRGWLPSSGGDGDLDEFARSGVGDGEMLVAGQKDARSFAPIEDAPFRSSDEPSLYDLFNELFDEPVRPRNNLDRTVGLPPELGNAVEQQMARSEQAARTFSTLRRGSNQAFQRPNDISSDAVLFVSGRVPLHLRLELFDVFDGREWFPELPSPLHPALHMTQRDGRPWLNWSAPAIGLRSDESIEQHVLKIGHLQTNRIPAPPQLAGVRIDRVEREDFFQWAADGIVRLQRESLPALLPIHVRSRAVPDDDWRRFFTHIANSDVRHRTLPVGQPVERVAKLAREWAGNASPGWQQVSRIVGRLRQEFMLDRTTASPPDCDFPVGQFLFESRRGPDYQFATAAALLLRSLGYSTRLVSGFYAAPENYDSRRRHTVVSKHDLHFWAEVYAGAGVWMTVEATPGYDVLQPPLSLTARVWNSLTALGRWLTRRWLPVCLTCLVTGLAWVFRFPVADAVQTLAWQLSRPRNAKALAHRTTRLLLCRLCWSGWQFEPGRTLRQRLTEVTNHNTAVCRDTVDRFCELTEWVSFASCGGESPVNGAECCRVILRELTLCRLRSSLPSRPDREVAHQVRHPVNALASRKMSAHYETLTKEAV